MENRERIFYIVIKRKFTAFHQHQDSGRGHGFGYRSQLKLRTQFQAVAMQVIGPANGILINDPAFFGNNTFR